MPRKNKNSDAIDTEEKKGGRLSSIIFAVLIFAVWIGIFILLIKLDVGGFGSSVMRPIFKDVPYINKILPNVREEDTAPEYPYKSLADAITRIKELEVEVQNLKDAADIDKGTIADLQAEIARLKRFEDEQKEFYDIQTKFYDEVVFGKDAIDYENYKIFYESINPDYAETLYKQVLQRYMYDERYRELADAYSAMKPAKAAAALYEMTGDLDKVVNILQGMKTENRASILNALSDLDPVFCGKITVMLAPEN